jgi:hypothetical protein
MGLMFTSDRVTNSGEALLYMTECTLATVEHMACLSRPSKGEYNRQIAIAQNGMNFIREFKVTPSGRVAKVAEAHGWDVQNWADKIRSKR